MRIRETMDDYQARVSCAITLIRRQIHDAIGCGDVRSGRLTWQTSYTEDEHSCSNISYKAGSRDVSSDRRIPA